jgi:hypothetical protein
MALSHSPSIVTDGLNTYLDTANPKSFSPNAFPNSLDYFSWYVTSQGSANATRCTLSQDFTTGRSPANGIPLRMDVTANDPYTNSYNNSNWRFCEARAGDTWRVSVYVKSSDVSGSCELFLFGVNSNGVGFIDGAWLNISAQAFTISNTWTRIERTITMTHPDVRFFQFRLDGPNSNGAGTTVWWDGVQVERSTSLSKFNPKFNQNMNNIFDLNKQNFNGTLVNNITYSENQLNFNGSSSHLLLGNPGNPQQFTFSIWVKPDALNINASNNFRELIKANTTLIVIEQDGLISFRVPGVTAANFTAGSVSINTWTNITCVYNQTDRLIYQNGVLVGQQNIGPGTVNLGTMQLSEESIQSYSGAIACYKMYNRALSADEIKQNFNALRGRYNL